MVPTGSTRSPDRRIYLMIIANATKVILASRSINRTREILRENETKKNMKFAFLYADLYGFSFVHTHAYTIVRSLANAHRSLSKWQLLKWRAYFPSWITHDFWYLYSTYVILLYSTRKTRPSKRCNAFETKF